MSKRTNSIVAVTIAKYATVYVEADTPKEAAEIVKNNIDDIYDEMFDKIDDDFDESEIEVDSYEAYTTDCEDYMDEIWADGKSMSYDEYMDELEDNEE
jgi:hypothetical protein